MKKISFIVALFFILPIFCFYGCKKETKCTDYTIDCRFDGKVLTGKETVCFFNDTDNAFSELKFNLFMNAYREDAKYFPIAKTYEKNAYPKGKDYGYIEISKVYFEDKDFNFEICGEDKNILSVKLFNEVFPNESVTVEIEFSVIYPFVISRSGINEDTVNMGNFYPILCGIENGSFYECLYYSNGDPFYSDCANYDVTITLSNEYVVASSGCLESVKDNGVESTKRYKINNARSFCFVLSKKFESICDNSLGIDITYYYIKDTNAQKSLKVAVESIKTFSELFGKYPYKSYSVVETPFNEGGMEYPALVYISSSLEEKAYQEVIVHETAHQWWQTAVGNNEIEYGFLDEGFAEYSVILFYENNASYNVKRKDLVQSCEKTYKTFCSVYDKIYGNVDTSMLRSLGEYESEYEYVNIAYIKGCLLHEYLRMGIGDGKYFEGVRKYYEEYCFKNASPDDFVGIFEKLGCDTNGFFNSFFNGSVII